VVKGDFQLTSASHILDTPLLILHFALEGIRILGSPARHIHNYLEGFLSERCHYHEIFFDFDTTKAVAAHGSRMVKLVTELQG
jgi:hypothetical protein